MLETREERVKLLKAGLSGKEIERLYIKGNNFKVTSFSPVVELLEIELCQYKNCCLRLEAAAKCG
ncbi:MAG: hypothetical protein KKG76_11755 [Euryarchaeota archaeon]|nr:hypothetical protein [Euryarchaeota archaeon]MBU4139347.1 hypothetical protein [Euryarchaeota archaeon]